MRHLILGGTGNVGSAVVERLVARGEPVRVLTRSEANAARLPAGAVPVVGDLLDPDCYSRVFADFDALLLIVAMADTELQQGLAAVNEARRAGARRIVYVSVHGVDAAPHLPHFAAKRAIEEAIRASGVPHVVLRPNHFYQNDRWVRDPIVRFGVYPQPIGDAGLSRVDARDVADAAAHALLRDGRESDVYTVAGPEALTGEAVARHYAEVLGREVRYAGNDVAAWAAAARGGGLPGWMVYDVGLMYAFIQERGLRAGDAERRETEEILGRAPRPFADFARELVDGAAAPER